MGCDFAQHRNTATAVATQVKDQFGLSARFHLVKRPYKLRVCLPRERHTATTIKLLKKLNDERTRIDMALRKGGYFFFGSGYQTISGNLSTAKHVFPSLISVMKANSDPDSFNNALRLSGLSYLPIALMEDLYKSRNMTRIMLERRLKADKEAKEWANLLKGGL